MFTAKANFSLGVNSGYGSGVSKMAASERVCSWDASLNGLGSEDNNFQNIFLPPDFVSNTSPSIQCAHMANHFVIINS